MCIVDGCVWFFVEDEELYWCLFVIVFLFCFIIVEFVMGDEVIEFFWDFEMNDWVCVSFNFKIDFLIVDL